MENHFLKYIQSITGGRAEGSAIERRHCSHLKPKRFSLLSPLSLSLSLSVRRWCANVHRLRTPCPRRGIVKYYTGAGGDVEGVTVSNFSSLSLSLSSHFFPSFFLSSSCRATSRGVSRAYQKCKLRDARRWRVFDIRHSELLFLLANYFRAVRHGVREFA